MGRFHSNSISPFSLLTNVALSSSLSFVICNLEFEDHLFKFPMVQCHRHFPWAPMARATIGEGQIGWSRKISITAPVSFLKNNRAGMTFVSLKNRIEFSGRKSVNFEKLEWVIFPSL